MPDYLAIHHDHAQEDIVDDGEEPIFYQSERYVLTLADFGIDANAWQQSRISYPEKWNPERKFREFTVYVEGRVEEPSDIWPAFGFLEFSLQLGEDDDLHEGQTFIVKELRDAEYDEALSNFYYYEHAPIRDLELAILTIGQDNMRVRANGRVLITGVNALVPPHNQPDASFSFDATLKFNPKRKRGVA